MPQLVEGDSDDDDCESPHSQSDAELVEGDHKESQLDAEQEPGHCNWEGYYYYRDHRDKQDRPE